MCIRDSFFLLLRRQRRCRPRLFRARRDFRRSNNRLRRRRFLGCGRGFGAVTLDENALLAHLDLDRACAPGAVGGLDLGRRFARQRDLFLRCQAAVLLAQIVQQTGLVLLGELVALLLAGNARGGELLQQRARGHFHFGRELLYCRQSHRVSPASRATAYSACSASSNQCARAFMIKSFARSAGIAFNSTSSSTARSASASRLVMPFSASNPAVSESIPSSPRRSSATFSTDSSRTMASVRSALRARLRSSLTV